MTAHAAAAEPSPHRQVRGGGSVRWTTDERDSWRAVTAGAVVTTVGASLAVFGLLPVNIHGPLHFYGIMDPLCGVTRAVRLALRGDIAASWRYNPLGTPVTLISLLLMARAAAGWTSGRWITVKLSPSRRANLVLVTITLLLVTALEVNQQMHASLLMIPR